MFLTVIADILRVIAQFGANTVSLAGSYQPETPDCLREE